MVTNLISFQMPRFLCSPSLGLILSSLLAFGVSNAIAADINPSPDIDAQLDTNRFAGFYAGAGIGVGGGLLSQFHSSTTSSPEQDLGIYGRLGYVRAGYDFSLSERVLAGVFADYTLSDEQFYYSIGSLYSHVNQLKKWSFGARLGVLPSQRQLWFLSGGASNADYRFILSGLGAPSDGQVTETYKGWFMGIGTETQLSGPLFLSLEVRLDHYPKQLNFTTSTSQWRERPTDLSLLAGLNYRYNAVSSQNYNPVGATGFQGFYLGGGIGYEALTGILDRSASGGDTQSHGINAFVGYGQIGYDYQIRPRWITGVFGEYTFGEKISRERVRNLSVRDTPGAVFGARLGYIVDDDALIYFTGGMTQHTFTVENSSAQFDDKSMIGWFAGLGAETRLAGNLYLKLEYRLESFKNEQFNYSVGTPGQLLRDSHIHGARLGVAYRF